MQFKLISACPLSQRHIVSSQIFIPLPMKYFEHLITEEHVCWQFHKVKPTNSLRTLIFLSHKLQAVVGNYFDYGIQVARAFASIYQHLYLHDFELLVMK